MSTNEQNQPATGIHDHAQQVIEIARAVQALYAGEKAEFHSPALPQALLFSAAVQASFGPMELPTS